MKIRASIIALLSIIVFSIFPAARTPAAESDSVLVFQMENDWVGGTDRYYTNGSKIIWVSRDMEEFGELGLLPGRAASALGGLPLMRIAGRRHNVGLSLGQDIYTPYDKSKYYMVDGDRPYAGWTYLSLALTAKNERCLDVLEATIGVVGPSSKAEQVQKEVHGWGMGAEPNGWGHQLGDEPGLLITWQRKWRPGGKRLSSGLGFDYVPHVGLTAGNVAAYANFGGLVRFGFNLPRDFGRGIIRPGEMPVTAPAADSEAGGETAPAIQGLLFSRTGRQGHGPQHFSGRKHFPGQ